MKIFVAGLNYRTAPVELREKLAVAPGRLHDTGDLLKLRADLSEVAILSTCNRVEIYGTTPEVNGNIHDIFRHLSASADFSPYLYVHEDAQAVQHLFSVASGMDSMVLGETEITGQVKQAYQAAQQAKLTGSVLNRLFQTALQTAKEVRTNTQIGRGSISVGSVAVELAEKIFDGDLCQKTVMIIGAGKMGEACLRHFAKKGAQSVLVCNRSLNKAEDLAKEFGGRPVPFDSLVQTLIDADIVVSSTGSPTTILHRQEVESILAARRGRPLFLIDIAVPRDIDPAIQDLNNVYLYNIDDLEKLMRENLRLREQELARCQAIIQEKTHAVLEKLAATIRNTQPSAIIGNRAAAAIPNDPQPSAKLNEAQPSALDNDTQLSATTGNDTQQYATKKTKQFWLGQALEKLSSQGPSGRKQQGCGSTAVQLQPTN